jgi:hypothetical protein
MSVRAVAAAHAALDVAARHERRCAVTTTTGNASSDAVAATGVATAFSDGVCSGRLKKTASVAVMTSAAARLTRRLAFMRALLGDFGG